jgi:hypothetical protein
MSGVASAIAGAAVVGGVAANSAAKKQVKGANNAITEQQRQFDLTRQDTLPQRQLGQDAISRIRQIYGTSGNTIDNATGQVIPGTATAPDMSGFFNSPDYQFNLAEGSKAINNSAAARSGVLSGRAVKEGERYASGLASREFSGFMDRLYQQAGIGSTGIGTAAAAGSNAANAIGAAAQNEGNARASAYTGINNAVQGGVSNFLLQQYLKPQPMMNHGYQAVNYSPNTGSYA